MTILLGLTQPIILSSKQIKEAEKAKKRCKSARKVISRKKSKSKRNKKVKTKKTPSNISIQVNRIIEKHEPINEVKPLTPEEEHHEKNRIKSTKNNKKKKKKKSPRPKTARAKKEPLLTIVGAKSTFFSEKETSDTPSIPSSSSKRDSYSLLNRDVIRMKSPNTLNTPRGMSKKKSKPKRRRSLMNFHVKLNETVSPVSPMTIPEDKYAYSPNKNFNVESVNKTDVIKVNNIDNIKLNFDKLHGFQPDASTSLDTARRLESPTLQKQDSLSKLFRHMPPSALVGEEVVDDDEDSGDEDSPSISRPIISATPRPSLKKSLKIDTSRIHSAKSARRMSASSARTASTSNTPQMSNRVFRRLTKSNKRLRSKSVTPNSLSNIVYSPEKSFEKIMIPKGRLRPMSARPALQASKQQKKRYQPNQLTPRCQKLKISSQEKHHSSQITSSTYEFAYNNYQILEKKMVHFIPTGTDDNDDKGTKNVFFASSQSLPKTPQSPSHSHCDMLQEKEWMLIFEYLDGMSLYNVSLVCKLFYTSIFNAYFMGRRLSRWKEIYMRWKQSQLGDSTIYMEDINRIRSMVQRIPDRDFVFLAEHLSSLEPFAKQAVLIVCRSLFPKTKAVRNLQQKLKNAHFRDDLISFDIENMSRTIYASLSQYVSDLSSIPEAEAKAISNILQGTDKLLVEGKSTSHKIEKVSARITRNTRIQNIIHLFILWIILQYKLFRSEHTNMLLSKTLLIENWINEFNNYRQRIFLQSSSKSNNTTVNE